MVHMMWSLTELSLVHELLLLGGDRLRRDE